MTVRATDLRAPPQPARRLRYRDHRVRHRLDEHPVGRQCRIVESGGRGRDQRRDPRIDVGRNTDQIVGAAGRRDLRREELAQTDPGDAADHSTDEVPEVRRVVAGRRAGFPPGCLLREQVLRPDGVADVGERHRLLPTAHTRRVTEDVTHQHRALAVRRELRPVAGDGRVQIELPTIDQQQRRECRHGLRQRVRVDDSVLDPRGARVDVRDTAPQVDHGLPLGYHTHRRPDVGAVVEVALQQVPQTRERGVGEALDGRHRAPTGACCARFSPAAISFFKSRT